MDLLEKQARILTLKNPLTDQKTRIVSFLAVATTIFLFASPAAFASSSRSGTTPSPTPVPVVRGPPAVAGPAGTSCKSGGCTYVAESGSYSVGVISKSNTLLTTISTDYGGCPEGATYDSLTKMVFVSDPCLGYIYEISTKTNTVVNTITGIFVPVFIACDDAIPMCFVTNFGDTAVTPFNPKTLAVGSPVTQCGQEPYFIAFDSKNGMLYVGNLFGSCVTEENPKTGATTTISVGYEITGVTVAKNGEVYVDDAFYDYVYVIKGSTVVSKIPTSGADLWGNAYNPEDDLVWVSSPGNDNAIAIKGTKVTATVGTQDFPASACTNPANNEVYVTNQESNTTTVIKGTAVLTTVGLGTGIDPFGCGSN